MPRRKKTVDDDDTNRRVGDVVSRLRKERGWTLQHVGIELGLSVSHVSALESGQYTFSALHIEKLSRLFQRPLATFLRDEFPPETHAIEWQHAFEVLSARDRVALLDLARKLSSWSSTLDHAHRAPPADGAGRLISLEGIDGEHLFSLGAALEAKARGAVVHCPHDYRGNLWRYMIDHFAKLDHLDKLDRDQNEHRALERTLLFACERLLRNSEHVQPALRAGKTVVASFFAMASSAYQETEGVGDRRIVDIVESLLPKPTAVVMLRSDSTLASRKAVPRAPKARQFYSPYNQDQLARAKRLHEKAVEEFRARGVPVHVFDVTDPLPEAVVDAVYERVVGKLPRARR